MHVQFKNFLAFSIFLCVISINALADITALVPDGARIETSSSDSGAFQLPSSALKRISNQARFESQLDVEGKLGRYLIRFEGRWTLDSLKSFYKEQLAGSENELLFDCEGRACGTSSDWANKVWAESKLTGRDSNQFYLLGKSNGVNSGYVSVYGVTNGRRQLYAYLNVIDLANTDQSMSSSTAGNDLGQLKDILESLEQDQSVILATYVDTASIESIAELRSVLEAKKLELSAYIEQLNPSLVDRVSIVPTLEPLGDSPFLVIDIN